MEELPAVNLDIQLVPVVAAPRALNVNWGPKRRFIDVVERLAAIADGKGDPGEWELLGPDPAEDLKSLWGGDTGITRDSAGIIEFGT